jgi:hypothetical protein
MFLNCSWMRRSNRKVAAAAFICLMLASATAAETDVVRVGRHFQDVIGRPFRDLDTIADVVEMLDIGTQLFVRDVRDCRGLTAVSPSEEHGRDSLQDTYVIIESIKVDCWAVLQFDPDAHLAATGEADRITPAMIWGVMAYADRLSSGNDEWRKTLTTFSGGDITCKDEERCLLALPDGKNPPDESVAFELILADGIGRFIEVTQMYQGRAGFVYGIHWHEAPSSGEVVAIFPDILQ